MPRPTTAAAPLLALTLTLAAPGPAAAAAEAPAPPPGTAWMTTAHRTSGVAPLAVFFDAVDTEPEGPAAPYRWRSGVVQPADPEAASYRWDFGDPGAGAWPHTGNRRGAATGYTAAHVFETPGRHLVTLEVAEAGGATRRYAQVITVLPFEGRTFYVSAAGDDANDGRSPERPLRSVARGLSMLTGSGRRLLFRRGDVFEAGAGSHLVTASGPGIIGAYGEGPRPVIRSAPAPERRLVEFRGPAKTVPVEDWRVMDLELVGPGGEGTTSAALGLQVEWAARDFLFLRLKLSRWNVGLGWGDWIPIFEHPRDGMAVVECEVDAAHQNGMYLGGRRLAVLGNDVHDTATSHALRIWQAHKAVVAENRLWRPGGQRHALKLHGPNVAVRAGGSYAARGTPGGAPVEPGREACPETRWVTISDNLFKGGERSNWTVSLGPQDSISDERVSHLVYERNRHEGGPATQVDLETSAAQVMIRNNAFDGTLDRAYAAVSIRRRGVEPPPAGYRLLHNTVHKGSANEETVGFDVTPEAAGVVIRNNLVSVRPGGRAALLRGGGGPGFEADHNLLTTAPGFADADRGDLSLRPGSPAVDAGAPAPEAPSDLLGRPRPRGAGPDLGAVESR